MSISEKAKREIKASWDDFCRSVVKAQAEHGKPLMCYFGATQVVCDVSRLMEHHDKRGGQGSSSYEDGGAVVVVLPPVQGFHQDGGDW